MATISLCMIVKNEEATLPRCLESVQGLAEEVVIVDTGSSDRTREIAGRYTPLVYDFPWQDDFAAARNFAFSKATQDYCLWVDADDVLLPQDRQRFLRLKASLPPDTDVVMLPYHTGGDGAGQPGLTYYRERLLRREAGFAWEGAVHEAIAPAGKVLYGDAAVTHKKNRPGGPGPEPADFGKREGETPPPAPGAVLLRQRAGRPRPGGGGRRAIPAVFGRGPGLGGKREAGLPRPGPVPGPPGQGGGGPGRPAAGAPLRPARRGAVLRAGGPLFGRGPAPPPRCSGTRPPSPAPRTAGPGGSSARSTTATTPACSCASAGTAWGTRPWPGPTTAAPRPVTRTAPCAGRTRHFLPAGKRGRRHLQQGKTPPSHQREGAGHSPGQARKKRR